MGRQNPAVRVLRRVGSSLLGPGLEGGVSLPGIGICIG